MEARWVDIAWTDLIGRTQVLRAGREACEAGGLTVPRSRVVSGYDGTPDGTAMLELRPDWSTERALPWDPAVAVCVADLYEDGAPSPCCTRGFLRSVVERAAARDLAVEAAVELEFYLVDPASGEPVYEEIDNYSLSRLETEPTVTAVRNELRAMAIGVEASNPEYGGGQVEINISHAPLLVAADQATLARLYVSELAGRAGLDAVFLPKPWTERSSSGIHVHQSLWRDGANLFFRPPEDLSDIGLAYLAGMLESVPSFALLGSPTPNGFHRRADGSFAPTVASWATDNRTTAVRAVLGGEGGTRIEHRDGASDCNLYLTMGAQVLAGLDGIERELQPPPPVVGNAYAQDLPQLPRTYVEAYERLRDCELAARILPGPLVGAYLEALEPEVELAILSAADWERARYSRVELA
ncbi:MAG: glutamine synthetase [Actinobacteria bacterium]|nr:glutamine synthetase [Actinomycetota bacterium]